MRTGEEGIPGEPTALLREAGKLLSTGEAARALQLLERGLATQPDHPALLSLKGLALAGLGRSADAVVVSRDAVRRAPHWPDGLANLGHVLQAVGQPAEAEAVLAEALAKDPRHFVAAMNLGRLQAISGRLDEAIPCFRLAVASQPANHSAQYNLALALRRAGQSSEALALFIAVFQKQPTQIEAANQAVAILMEMLQPQEALALLDRAIQRVPGHARSHNNRGTALRALGRAAEGLEAYRQATRLAPDHADAWRNLGLLAGDQGLTEEAAAAFRQVLRSQPADPVARHMLDAMEGRTTAAPPQAYVARSFDSFADSFDHQLKNLDYRVPEAMAALAQRLAPEQRFDRALDLGCGTGLVAVGFGPLVADWTGVDLSPRMLARADARGLYARLAVGEVVEFLTADPTLYDLITAADVLIYLGDLAPLFAQVAHHLRPDGLFLFSIERLADDNRDSQLTVSGRYAQSDAYIARLAAASGLELRRRDDVVVRQEHRAPVQGSLFALARQREA